MNLKFYPYTLKLKQRFTLSHHSRLTTPVVMIEIEHDGITGYGEASLPQYLDEDQQSVMNFLNKVNLTQFNDPLQLDDIINAIDLIEPGNNAAKAGLDIAMHDLVGRMLNIPAYTYLNIS